MHFKVLITTILIIASTGAGLFSQVEEINANNYNKHPLAQSAINLESPNAELLSQLIFHLCNKERGKRGIEVLKYSAPLEKSAALHAKNMNKKGFFAHNDPTSKKYRTPNDRAKVVGITNANISENIIEGYLIKYKSNTKVIPVDKGVFLHASNRKKIEPHTYISLAEELVDRWMKSKGHKKNILFKDALELGIGIAFFTNSDFNDMPSLLAVQNFQNYEKTISE